MTGLILVVFFLSRNLHNTQVDVISYGYHILIQTLTVCIKQSLSAHGGYKMTKKLMTAKQMTKHLQISKTTLREYAAKGLVGVWQPGGKNCAVRYYELEAPDGDTHKS